MFSKVSSLQTWLEIDSGVLAAPAREWLKTRLRVPFQREPGCHFAIVRLGRRRASASDPPPSPAEQLFQFMIGVVRSQGADGSHRVLRHLGQRRQIRRIFSMRCIPFIGPGPAVNRPHGWNKIRPKNAVVLGIPCVAGIWPVDGVWDVEQAIKVARNRLSGSLIQGNGGWDGHVAK